MHYVIGDVHGCLDEMLNLISKIEEQDKNAQFVFVGDFVDRGPQVWEVIEWFMEHITPEGKYQSVLGNHEEMVLEWFEEFKKWERRGRQGSAPRTSYDFLEQAILHDCDNSKELSFFINFLKKLPYNIHLNIETAENTKTEYVVTHAGYDFSEKPFSEKQKEANLWERNYYGYSSDNPIVVHGHTPTALHDWMLRNTTDRPGLVSYRSNAINVDGGCVFNNQEINYPCMLCAICLETLEEFYCSSIEERMMSKNVHVKNICPKFMTDEESKIQLLQIKLEDYVATYPEKENPYKKAMLEKIGRTEQIEKDIEF